MEPEPAKGASYELRVATSHTLSRDESINMQLIESNSAVSSPLAPIRMAFAHASKTDLDPWRDETAAQPGIITPAHQLGSGTRWALGGQVGGWGHPTPVK